MTALSKPLRRALAKAVRIHGEVGTDAVADALAEVLPQPQWAAAVRPGDTLVVTYDRSFDPAELEELLDGYRRYLPGIKIAIIEQATGLAIAPATCTCDLLDAIANALDFGVRLVSRKTGAVV